MIPVVLWTCHDNLKKSAEKDHALRAAKEAEIDRRLKEEMETDHI
jgi:hypothetical protein